MGNFHEEASYGHSEDHIEDAIGDKNQDRLNLEEKKDSKLVVNACFKNSILKAIQDRGNEEDLAKVIKHKEKLLAEKNKLIESLFQLFQKGYKSSKH